jgi:carbon monoxide dehydrogenase subunit G
MDLTHRFTVPAPLPDAWAAFNDVETLAPCFPGATVSSADGDDFAGSVKIKIGPLGLVYEGTGGYLERNAGARRTVIQTRGRDKRGNGMAITTITATFTNRGDRTEVALHTDLDLSGKPARFGRDVVTDVVDRVVDQFSSALAGKFAEGEVAAPAAPPDVRRRSLPAEDAPTAGEPVAADFSDSEVSGAPATGTSAGGVGGRPPTQDTDIPADSDPTIELGAVPGDVDESGDGRTDIEERLDIPAPDEVAAASESAAEPAPRRAAPTEPATPRPYAPPRNTAQPHVKVAGTMTSGVVGQLKQYGPALAILSVIAFLAIRILRRKS